MTVCACRASGRKACRYFYLLVAFTLATFSGCNCLNFSSTPCQICDDGTCDQGCEGLFGCYRVYFQGDPDNCGGCGHVCGSGTICSSGQCTNCSPNLICGSACVDPKTDARNCGASGDCTGANAGTDCGGGCECVNASCAVPTGRVFCAASDSKCVDPNSDPGFCGASGDCTGASAGARCGSCACVNGSCQFPDAGVVICPGSGCIDPLYDQNYCGASGDCTGANAGIACGTGASCRQGSCQCDYETCGTGCCPYAPCTSCINEQCQVTAYCNEVCCQPGQSCSPDGGACI
jgi:hypothetical protein